MCISVLVYGWIEWGVKKVDKIREATRHGLAQWRQYPQLGRGPPASLATRLFSMRIARKRTGFTNGLKTLYFWSWPSLHGAENNSTHKPYPHSSEGMVCCGIELQRSEVVRVESLWRLGVTSP
jgi:hypothetical protein